jgi:hypothetical protein
MEKILSTVIIHKIINSLDTRFPKMDQYLVNNPLEQNLGFFDFEKYHKAADNAYYTFMCVNKIWDEPLEQNTSDEENAGPATDTSEKSYLGYSCALMLLHLSTEVTGARAMKPSKYC